LRDAALGDGAPRLRPTPALAEAGAMLR
jgi:hypothetical protein